MQTDPLQPDIEKRLATAEPEVELLACERVGADRLRLFIDHPDGVSLALCERVTNHLGTCWSTTALEVSSPGPRAAAHQARPLPALPRPPRPLRLREPSDGHKSFTGELVGASDDEVTVAADEGVVSIPYSDINQSNLLEGER